MVGGKRFLGVGKIFLNSGGGDGRGKIFEILEGGEQKKIFQNSGGGGMGGERPRSLGGIPPPPPPPLLGLFLYIWNLIKRKSVLGVYKKRLDGAKRN